MLPITSHTRLTGILGNPVTHSISPVMHNTSFAHLGLDYVYLAFEIEASALEAAVAGLRSLGAAGFNVTMPYKQAVIPLLDELTQEARIIGAVNTVINNHGRLIGTNTDGKGYVDSLKGAGISIRGSRIVLLGAGGAAKSIGMQLALEGAAELIIANRSRQPAMALGEMIEKAVPDCRVEILPLDQQALITACRPARVLINTSSIGMGVHEGKSLITDASVFHPNLFVSDIIYAPRRTKLMEMAETAGCDTANGVGMIIGQGALSFKLWTGHSMPTEPVKTTLGL